MKTVFGSLRLLLASLALVSNAQAAPGDLKWEFLTDESEWETGVSSPAIGLDGTVYIGSYDHMVRALNGANGNLKWAFEAEWRVGAVAIGSDGTVYATSSDKVYAIDGAIGAQKWRFTGTIEFTYCSPAIGADGAVYVGSTRGMYYALDGATSFQKWALTEVDRYNPRSSAIGLDGTIYAGMDQLYALDGKASGFKKWAFNAVGNNLIYNPSVSADDTVYVTSSSNVFALDGATGNQKWTSALDGGSSVQPSIGVDGTVYVGADKLYALNGATGTRKWTFPRGWIQSSAAIAADGTVYVGCADKKFYALNGSTGSMKWTFATEGQIFSSPAIGADGTVYVGSTDRKIYAIEGTAGLAKSAWPKFMGNNQNTGRATTAVSLSKPQIVHPPQSSSVASGQTQILTVLASGVEPMMYQWFVGASVETSQSVAGATNASFTTGPLTATTTYWVRVTDANGSVDSQAATITVVPKPAITRPILRILKSSLDSVTVEIQGDNDSRWELQRSEDLVGWTATGDVILIQNGKATATIAVSPGRVVFLRLVLSSTF